MIRSTFSKHPFPSNTMSKIRILLLFCYLPIQLFAQEQRFEFEKGLMGSPFKLVFYAPDEAIAGRAADSAFARIGALNTIMSDYLDGSEINHLSATSGSGKAVVVSQDLYSIIRQSVEISAKTAGAFDITVGPVIQLWRRAMRRNYFPAPKEIDEARAGVGYKFVKLDGKNKVTLLTKGMRLDVGGIGKGLAADEAVRILKHFGIKSAMADAGGDLSLADAPPGAPGWKITVSSGEDSIQTYVLANVGVATSGASYRFIEHDGVKYSHIVDPKTGVGLTHHVRTTIVAPNGTLADALATAVSVAGVEKSKKMIRKFPGTKAWLIESRNGREYSWNTL